MSGNNEERSEKASPQKLKKVHQEGNLSRSQDLSAWLVVAAAAFMVPGTIGNAYAGLFRVLGTATVSMENPSPARAVDVLTIGFREIPSMIGALLGVVFITALAGSAAQGGVHIATKRMKPSFKRLNPVKGLKRIFGAQAWWQGAKVLAKTAVVGLVLYSIVAGMVQFIGSTGRIPVRQMLEQISDGFGSLLWSAVAAGLALAAIDVFVVIRRNRKQTRMSKKELKDEHKNTEGNPLIKGAIRNKQAALSRNRMLAAVADSDVVIVNPTHVAVAIRYRPGEGVPTVVAKGHDLVAARIRETALKHRIPVVRNVPVARALDAACALGGVIPNEMYEDVARVLAFVFALRRRGAAAGTHTMADVQSKDSQ